MRIQVREKTVDLDFNLNGDTVARVLADNEEPAHDAKVLRMRFSLMGETLPVLSPLSLEYSFGEDTPAYRYDWTVGIALKNREEHGWDWIKKIRPERSISVQLLIDSRQSGCSYSEVSASLLTLQPGKNTSSWFERHAEQVGDSLGSLATIAEPINTNVANVIKVSSLVSNFIHSDSGKNWYIYRFVDDERKCCAVEWNINRTVLEQQGPLLRGSIILTFHGTRTTHDPIKMLLRPMLGFNTKDPLKLTPQPEELERDSPVEISIEPQSGS